MRAKNGEVSASVSGHSKAVGRRGRRAAIRLRRDDSLPASVAMELKEKTRCGRTLPGPDSAPVVVRYELSRLRPLLHPEIGAVRVRELFARIERAEDSALIGALHFFEWDA